MVAGMGKELKMEGNAYVSSWREIRTHLLILDIVQTLLILVFFPFYIVFQAPMIAIGRKVGPRYFITFIVVAWGLVMVGHGLVKSWRTMLALRCLLGIFEAGYYSMASFLLSTWYIRSTLYHSLNRCRY